MPKTKAVREANPEHPYQKKYPYICKSKYEGWMPPIKGDAITVLQVRSSRPDGGGSSRVCIVSNERHTRIMPYGRISHSIMMDRDKVAPAIKRAYMRKAWDESLPIVAEDPVPPRKRAEHTRTAKVVLPVSADAPVAPDDSFGLINYALNIIDQLNSQPELKGIFDCLYERLGKKG